MSGLVIRAATQGDFEYVVHLMEEALAPYYGGDHRAHAKRIFESHVSGGVDHLGFFSVGQSMFVAEIDGCRAGVLHLVQKRQGTVKISPLIVSAEFRRIRGIGKALLKHAEEYARSNNARIIYCTVAEQNQLAFDFFLRNGYVRAGRSPSHYKDGITETMLYKFTNDELPDSFDRDHISVLPLEEEHRQAVRSLLLQQLPDHFMGVNDEWVTNLFGGYDRRESRDINLKYKLIYTAVDRNNELRGVAGGHAEEGRAH